MAQLLHLPTEDEAPTKLTCAEHIGFDNLPDQMVRNLSKRENQYCLNLMVLGATCSGKSTLIETIFNEPFEPEDLHTKGHGNPDIRIHTVEKVLQDGAVKVNVAINTCTGFGDQLDTGGSAQTPVNYIEGKFATKLEVELKADRDPQAKDPLVHACLYLLAPTGREMKELDIRVLKQLHSCVNVIPVIAKADGLTPEELTDFKRVIKSTLAKHKIAVYKPSSTASSPSSPYEEEYPLAVVASMDIATINGVDARVREYPWGVVEVENHKHSQLPQLRNFLLRDETFALIHSTKSKIFNRYRQDQLTKMGFVDFDGDKNPMGLLANLAAKKRQKLGESNVREAEIRAKFVRMAKSKELQMNSSMEALTSKFDRLKSIHSEEEKKLRSLIEQKKLERTSWLEEQKKDKK